MSPLIILLIFLLLILCMMAFYYITTYHVEEAVVRSSIVDVLSAPNEEVMKKCTDQKLSVLSNYFDGKVESRVVNVVIYKNEFYTYANVNLKRIQQLSQNNVVSLLMYIREGSIKKQILLYGQLELVRQIDDLCIYKFVVENRKTTFTKDTNDSHITNYKYNNESSVEIKNTYANIVDVVSYIKAQ